MPLLENVRRVTIELDDDTVLDFLGDEVTATRVRTVIPSEGPILSKAVQYIMVQCREQVTDDVIQRP